MNDNNIPAVEPEPIYVCYFCGITVSKSAVFCEMCDELEWNKDPDPGNWPDVLKFPKKIVER